MSSAMSGASVRMSTMPASAMVLAGEMAGAGSAIAAPAVRASAEARKIAAALFTRMLPNEREILVVVAEIGFGIHLGHVQRASGLFREAQPCLGVAVIPVHQILVADAHHLP